MDSVTKSLRKWFFSKETQKGRSDDKIVLWTSSSFLLLSEVLNHLAPGLSAISGVSTLAQDLPQNNIMI